jgi:cell wall-associated NlpC family hydrolase
MLGMLAMALPAGTAAAQGPAPANTGGAAYGVIPAKPAADITPPGAAAPVPAPAPVPGSEAVLGPDGFAQAPADAPPQVQEAIAAANQIIGLPYRYGGGHRLPWKLDRGYDCSGTVSWALHGGDLLKRPLDSSSFLRWGEAGPGQWITVYTRSSHAFMVIAGLRLDTSAAGDPSGAKGPRWRPVLRSTRGFKARHPDGL